MAKKVGMVHPLEIAAMEKEIDELLKQVADL
jgi:hypothetical protein